MVAPHMCLQLYEVLYTHFWQGICFEFVDNLVVRFSFCSEDAIITTIFLFAWKCLILIPFTFSLSFWNLSKTWVLHWRNIFFGADWIQAHVEILHFLFPCYFSLLLFSIPFFLGISIFVSCIQIIYTLIHRILFSLTSLTRQWVLCWFESDNFTLLVFIAI